VHGSVELVRRNVVLTENGQNISEVSHKFWFKRGCFILSGIAFFPGGVARGVLIATSAVTWHGQEYANALPRWFRALLRRPARPRAPPRHVQGCICGEISATRAGRRRPQAFFCLVSMVLQWRPKKHILTGRLATFGLGRANEMVRLVGRGPNELVRF
jgi:hypothetical protein